MISLTKNNILLGYDKVTLKGFSQIVCQCETKKQAEAMRQQILEWQKWYEKKNRYYEIKDELQQVIKKRNLELVHVKKKLSKLIAEISEVKESTYFKNVTINNLRYENNQLIEKLDNIQVFCGGLLDGDPDNENPKSILNTIDNMLGKEYFGDKK